MVTPRLKLHRHNQYSLDHHVRYFGVLNCGLFWAILVWSGLFRCGLFWSSLVWCGLLWCCLFWWYLWYWVVVNTLVAITYLCNYIFAIDSGPYYYYLGSRAVDCRKDNADQLLSLCPIAVSHMSCWTLLVNTHNTFTSCCYHWNKSISWMVIVFFEMVNRVKVYLGWNKSALLEKSIIVVLLHQLYHFAYLSNLFIQQCYYHIFVISYQHTTLVSVH